MNDSANLKVEKSPEHKEMDRLYSEVRKRLNSDDPAIVKQAVSELDALEKRCQAAGIK